MWERVALLNNAHFLVTCSQLCKCCSSHTFCSQREGDRKEICNVAGAKVCRGGCGIAIVGVYRDKSRYLAFAATYRDKILFPR